MPRKSPFPDSQRTIVRNAARRARREAGSDVATAKAILGVNLSREIGLAWMLEAVELGESLLDYWQANAVESPTIQWIEGEPR